MSNIIRGQSNSPLNTKIIQTKKIEIQKMGFTNLNMDANDKTQFLLQEFESLESQYMQLQNQIKQEQEESLLAIDRWWSEKQEEASQHAKQQEEKAIEQGFQAGYNQGFQQAQQEFQQQRQEMQELLEAAYAEKKRIVQQSEPFLLSLSVKVAEKIIKEELNQDDKQVLNVVKQALKLIEETEDVVMQVSPDDYPVILPFSEELKTYVRADSELKIIPVAALVKGDCMIHTASGSYDVTIDGQLAEIKKQMLIHFEEKTSDELMER